MNISSLNQYLVERKIEAEIIEHDRPIRSKSDAAGIFNIEHTAPTLILDTDKGYLALIISGEREKIDFRQLKKSLSCKKLQLANSSELHEKLNITIGQVPLLTHNLPCIIDEKLFKHPYIYGGTGDLFYTLKISPLQLEKASNVLFKFK